MSSPADSLATSTAQASRCDNFNVRLRQRLPDMLDGPSSGLVTVQDGLT